MSSSRPSLITGDIFFSDDHDSALAAWRPFELCVGTLHYLQNSDTEPRWSGWLLYWIAGVSLLRSTGHVLKNIDARTSERHNSVIKERWLQWQTDRNTNWIFWEFIQDERNNILKEFRFGFETSPYLEPEEYEVEGSVYDKMELFREAVYWWRSELRTIGRALLST